MGSISLRLPDSLHEQVRLMAEKDNISINQMITLALAQVPDVEPDEDDRIMSS